MNTEVCSITLLEEAGSVSAFDGGPAPLWSAGSLQAARSRMPDGMIVLGRSRGDAPEVLEAWGRLPRGWKSLTPTTS